MKPVHFFAILISLLASAVLCVGIAMFGYRLTFDEMAAGDAGLSLGKQIAGIIVQCLFFIPLLFRKIFDSNSAVAVAFALQFLFYAVVFYFPILKVSKKIILSREGKEENEN